MIFDKINHNEITVPSIVIVAAGGFFTLVPIYRIIGRGLGKTACYRTHEHEQEKDMDTDYTNFRTQFLSEYDRANPITHGKAMQEYFKFLERKME